MTPAHSCIHTDRYFRHIRPQAHKAPNQPAVPHVHQEAPQGQHAHCRMPILTRTLKIWLAYQAPQECSNQPLMAQPFHSNSPLAARWRYIARERGSATSQDTVSCEWWQRQKKKKRKHHQRPDQASKNVKNERPIFSGACYSGTSYLLDIITSPGPAYFAQYAEKPRVLKYCHMNE